MERNSTKKFESFLRLLEREGYPNENVSDFAQLVGYDLDNLLVDFVLNLGVDKTEEFVKRGLDVIFGPSKKLRLDFSRDYGQGAFVDYILEDFYVDLNDTADGIRIEKKFGDSALEDDRGVLKSLEQIYHDSDMGDWWGFDELVDSLNRDLAKYLNKRLGYFIYI